jgi:P4 family phage/plasmid primase-like protien
MSSAEAIDTQKFFRHVFGGQRGLLCIVTAVRAEDGKWVEDSNRARYFDFPGELEQACEHARAESQQGREAYFCAHLLTDKRRIKENAGSVITLWGDLDGAAVPNGDRRPTAVVESSPDRYHIYYRLSDAVSPETAEDLNKRLAGDIGADPSGFDLTQLLRVPGTVNHKYPGRPAVRVLSLNGTQSYVPGELDARLTALSQRDPGKHTTMDEPPVMLDEAGMRVWRGEEPKYKDNGEIDRSSTLLKIGRVEYDAGANRPAIVASLAERDRALGYNKYTDRDDAEQRYQKIVDELEESGRNTRTNITFGRSSNSSNGTSASAKTGPVADIPPEKLSATKVLADIICADNHFAQDAGGKLYRYSGGVYKLYAERFIQQQVKAVLEDRGLWDKWSSHRASEVVEYIRVDAPDLWERPPLNRANLANGILDLNTRTLAPHSPDFLSPVQLPVEYDPDARCPAWDQFVETTFPEDAQDLAFEMISDLMTPDRSIQKALLLIGEGDNGKSVYLRAVGAFAGSTNMAGVSIHKLESDRFAASRLIGKLANICPDLPSEHLSQTSVFKAVTGGDVLNAEYKYRESFEFVPYARMLFSANAAPRASDASHAFFRRWLVVPFEASFTEEEKLPREVLDARLADPSELSGVLNKALALRARVRDKGFTESESMREAAEEFRQMTDPVRVWIDQNTIEGVQVFVSKDALAKAYNESRARAGQAGMTKKAFALALKRARPEVEDGRRTVSGHTTHCWIGLGLKSNEPEQQSNGIRKERI